MNIDVKFTEKDCSFSPGFGEVQIVDSGYQQGYTAGQTAEYNRFWNAYQSNGNRTNYYRKFVENGWNDNTFRPKYNITCVGKGSSTDTQAQNVFDNSAITRIPVDVVITDAPANNLFYSCDDLVTITKLVLNNVLSFSGAFTRCSALENITIDGSINANFSVSASAVLTNESVQSIIDHLADRTGQTQLTLGLHSTVLANLTDEQSLAIYAKNWTF